MVMYRLGVYVHRPLPILQHCHLRNLTPFSTSSFGWKPTLLLAPISSSILSAPLGSPWSVEIVILHSALMDTRSAENRKGDPLSRSLGITTLFLTPPRVSSASSLFFDVSSASFPFFSLSFGSSSIDLILKLFLLTRWATKAPSMKMKPARTNSCPAAKTATNQPSPLSSSSWFPCALPWEIEAAKTMNFNARSYSSFSILTSLPHVVWIPLSPSTLLPFSSFPSFSSYQDRSTSMTYSSFS